MAAWRKLDRIAAAASLMLLSVGFAPSALAQECVAVPQATGTAEDGFNVTSVAVTCAAGDQTNLFATSFTDAFGGTVVIDDGSGNDGVPIIATYPTASYDGNGADSITINGGTLSDTGGFLTPRLVFSGNVDGGVYRLDPSTSVIETLGGNDTVEMTGGTILGGIVLGAGDDAFDLSGGSISGSVLGDDETSVGNDTFVVSGGSIGGSIFAGGGNDSVEISGTAQIGIAIGGPDSVGLESGDDEFVMSGGTLAGSVSGNLGNDSITLDGGSIGGFIAGNEGDDEVTVNGGTIAGGIEAESVSLFGGTIGGDITGLSGNTLTIQSNSLNLRNGVLFQGDNAVGTITGTNLAQAAGGAFRNQNFDGFSALTLQGSTIGLAGGSQEIGNLSVFGNSTLFASGQTTLTSPSGGRGNLTVVNSTVNLINGSTADRLNVGNLTLNNATLGIDLDAQQNLADQLPASGSFNAAGSNLIQVNIVGTPVFANAGVIAIAPVAGEIAPQSSTPPAQFTVVGNVAPANGTSTLFTVAGLPATPGALFDFAVVNGSNGGLYIVVVPVNFADPLATRTAIDSSVVDNINSTVNGILGDAVLTHLGLLSVASRSDAAPNFGVYASGQFARTNHDGFTVSNSSFSGSGPSFTADDFSLAASVEFDAAQYFGIDQAYGLDIGLFGGYASSHVELDPTLAFEDVGEADNRAGMIGTYGLLRKGTAYGLVSATGFFGGTDIDNYVLNSTGDYDTVGFAVTGSVGKVYPISENWRVDVRGGLLGVNFEGDGFEDSQGNDFGKSRISFGAVKFEPGIFGQYVLEDNRVLSPYVRLELQQRFAYENTSSLDGVDFDFDDSDFSSSLSGGVNYQITPTTTLSTELRGKLSSDSDTFAGKLGIKAKF